MEIIRCNQSHIGYAIEAVNVVKNEDENDGILIERADMEIFLQNPANHLYVSVIDKKVVGFLVAYELQRIDRNSKMMFFYEISVLKMFRCNGAGLALVETLKEYCINNNFMKMFLPTNRSNLPAMNLYRKAGGQESVDNDEVFFTWQFLQEH